MLLIQVLLSVFVFSCVSCATADFRNPIDSMETSIGISTETLIKTVTDMANKIKTLEAKVEKLERLEDKIAYLEETMMLKNEKIAKMERVVKALITEPCNNSESKDSTEPTDTSNSKDRHDVQLHTKDKHRGIRQIETVGFSTVLTNHLQHLGKKLVIKFNKILKNDGNGYDPNTGFFAAPLTGTYLFIYNFGHHSTGETWLELVKNGVAQNSAAVEGHFGGQNLQGGNAAIIHLNQGDRVWVETYLVSDVSLHAQTTTFSGVFLY
ncbi:collagen alpha-1(VIII) chain-like [Mercenaria mercenaria]|uniref:collagen alpha-1(VIII) chain-like n=1 Tax=Mercenaria mercenaria TaxID=6596 RepID=UPI00234EC1B0|nr:collagen alpha-1(VIII) chain-like [Mercenaria mercenaria]